MSVYRPVGYGPPPTDEEKAAAAEQLGTEHTKWLCEYEWGALCLEWDDSIRSSAIRCCLLGPDGLPCAIGTLPEQEPTEPSERERLLREAVEARRATLAPTGIVSPPDWRRELGAARAYLDHIIAEEDARD